MATEPEKSDPKKSKRDQDKTVKRKWDLDDIDLGDADGSSSATVRDNFKPSDKNQLPSEKGRIEEL